MFKDYSHIGLFFLNIKDARLSDFFDALKAQPDYSENDNPFVEKFEAKGGSYSPPGALTLKEHDIIHFLCGVNFVPYDTNNLRKDGERFLSGFQFGGDPDFTDDHAYQFVKNIDDPKNEAPEDYKFSERGLGLFLLGIELGREWHKSTGLSLQAIAEKALVENPRLIDLYNDFWGQSFGQYGMI